MSITRKRTDQGNAELEREVRDIKAAGESTAALLSALFRAQIITDRATGTSVITDETIVQSAEVVKYPDYADKHDYAMGEIVRFDGALFEIITAHTSSKKKYPVKGDPEHYRQIAGADKLGGEGA